MSPPALVGIYFGRAPIALGVPVDIGIHCTDLPMGRWITGVLGKIWICLGIWTFGAREAEAGVTALSGSDDTGTATVGVAIEAWSLMIGEDIMQ
jgi:hypothetical protein